MAADVSTGNNKQENEAKKGPLFTRDLLGGSGSGAACFSGEELDATVEWEKKFDLLLGQRSRVSASRPINLNLPPPPPPCFSSVCTLEKVKSALERANGKSNGSASSSSSSSPSSSSSIKRSATAEMTKTDGQDAKAVGGPMMISRCPKCMQYLLVFKVDPRCPRCDAHVPEPNYMKKNNNHNNKKKAKIDLNESITD